MNEGRHNNRKIAERILTLLSTYWFLRILRKIKDEEYVRNKELFINQTLHMLSMIQETVLQEGYLSSTRCHRCSKTAGRGSRSPGGWARTGRRRRDRGLRAEGRRGSRSGCYSSRGSRCCSRRDTRRRSQVGTGLEHNLLCNMTDNDFSLDHCGC